MSVRQSQLTPSPFVQKWFVSGPAYQVWYADEMQMACAQVTLRLAL